jgi:DNA-binding response OmpR family regulator
MYSALNRLPKESLLATEGVRILLLEDEALITLDIRNDLKSWGYSTVTIAHNEAQAREKIEKHWPTLAIVDVALGDEDGIEIAGRLSQEFGFSVIFLTAHSDLKTRERILASQQVGFLFKPYSSYALYDFLAAL